MSVVVVGNGLIGLSAAIALEQHGANVTLIGERRVGEASPAGAGMLGPSVEHAHGAAFDFAIAARDRYPAFIEWIARTTGVHVALDRSGVIELAHTAADVARLRAQVGDDARWLDPAELHDLEPGLSPTLGALLRESDGWVDSGTLVSAMRDYASRAPGITHVSDPAVALSRGFRGIAVACASGRQHDASCVILANGAWAGEMRGLPRPLPVEPVRGQMISVAAPLGHVVVGGGGYAIPRRTGETFIGATMERVGFDNSITVDALEMLQGVARNLGPQLGAAEVTRQWAGLRPITPDLQPIIGRDPSLPELIYACGHSRNGILMAPLTGDVVASLALGEEPWFDLAPFSVLRFAR